MTQQGAEPTAYDSAGLIRRTIWSVVSVLLVGVMAGWLFREELVVAGEWLVGHLGPQGVFLAVFFIDWIPIPTTNEPILLLGVTAGMPTLTLFVAAASASVAAAVGGYGSGYLLDRFTPLGQRVALAFPGTVQWVRERGTLGLCMASLLPLPFATFMWVGGVVGLRFDRVLIASLLRIPKTAFYLWLIAAGWSLT